MQWEKKSEYHLESLGHGLSATQSVSYSISKSIVYGKKIYELWELPYNNAKLICRGESVSDVKAQAVQHYRRKFASINAEAQRSIGESWGQELAGTD